MRGSAPARQFALLAGLFLAGVSLLALRAGVVEAGPGWRGLPSGLLTARADSDTLVLGRDSLDAAIEDVVAFLDDPTSVDSMSVDSMSIDSALALRDTTDADTLLRSRAYFPTVRAEGYGASLSPRRRSGLAGVLGPYWQRDVTLDSTAYQYAIRETVGGEDVRTPVALSLDSFLVARRRTAVRDGFRDLATRRNSRAQRRGGLGLTVDIPGGQGGAFSTIFGKNEVDLRVNGTSTVDVGGSYDKNERQDNASNRNGRFDPLFGQELNLNVAGTIGDKLRINVNYDTQSQFDFENKVSLVYTGYEDDIVQRFEAGNVFLQTPSELIRGGQRLFGLRTDLQFGPLAMTVVASQQDAQSNEVVVEGGSQATPFELDPFQYENDTHFFIGYAFHNWWDRAHRRPGINQPHPDLQQLEGIEVWKWDQSLNRANDTEEETTWAIALADLGEPAEVAVSQGDGDEVGGEAYLGEPLPGGGYANEAAPLPAPAQDRYSEDDLATLRANVGTELYGRFANELGTGAANRQFRKLKENVDYTFDAQLGWISLTSSLADNEVLAVSYRYRRSDNSVVTVGDFNDATKENSLTGPRILLKLLRNDAPTETDPLWDLTMRNIYRVGGRSLNPSNFTLDVKYKAPGSTAQPLLPGIQFGDSQTLLTVLGLDRVNGQGLANPDALFDFQPNVTILPGSGRVIFPVRQPFGDYLERLIRDGLTNGQAPTVSGDNILVSSPTGLSPDAAVTEYAFPELYDRTPASIRRQPGNLVRYDIEGESKGASQSTINAGFNLVEGSVRVYAGNNELSEGVDYRVNYSAGQVEIINAVYLQGTQQIRVESEQQKFASIGGKTLVGLRADYDLGDGVGLGATFMRLNERPLTPKFRVGEEALRNGILGLDGRYEADPLWITRALDALPLLQTRADSRISVRGEFARLLPGHPQTLAFNEARRRIANNNGAPNAGQFVFPDDELAGASYVDDFEGSETAYTDFEQTTGWRLAAAPDSAGPRNPVPPTTVLTPEDVTNPGLVSNWRGLFTWYTLSSRDLYDRFARLGQATNAATRQIPEEDLFPGRDYPDSETALRPIGSLDVYFDPTQRGPYNYSADLGQLRASPQTAWGGMTQAIRNSFSDFGGQNNIEFIEILMAPLGGRDGTEAISAGAEMYIDLGRINEDILPNTLLNSEDGILDAQLSGPEDQELDAWGRLPAGSTNGFADFREESGRTEDVGLDGLPSRRDLVAAGGQPYAYSEQEQYAPFVSSITDARERARAERDPSGDDFHHYAEESYFNDPALFPDGVTIQERYSRFYPATELNTTTANDRIADQVDDGVGGIATSANSEDVNANSSLDVTERYHRYRIPLDADGLRASPFFQNTIPSEDLQETWYLLRIPIRTESAERVTKDLERDDFSRIEALRLWTTGHDKPATIRIKSFEMVGSQWLKSDLVGEPRIGGDGDVNNGPGPALFIESVNDEESSSIYASPRGTVLNTSASLTGATTNLREQSIVFRAEGLADGRDAGIVRSYATRPLDLTKYSNLRAYVHGHGFERSDSIRVFVRLGDDETENYYEYSQPVYPFDPLDGLADSETARADSLWQTAVRVGGETIDRNSINVVLSELNRLKVERNNDSEASFTEVYTSRGAPEGAPRGARIAVVGQPSIQDVETIVLGMRNEEGGQILVDTVTVWYNELRVTGYDEAPASSGFLAANIQLADVARVDARYSFTQDGFGDLGSGLGEREFAARGALSLATQFNAHKLLPERYGWRIPVSYSYSDNQSSPRFDPDQGDIRVSTRVEQARGDESLTEAERVIDADDILERTQTVAQQQSFRIQGQKTGSRSEILQYTLDKFTAAYSASSRDARSPVNRSSTAESWKADANYTLAVPKPKTVTPLWLLRPVPLLGDVLGGLQLNVLPRQLTLSTSAGRSQSATTPRLRSIFENEPVSIQPYLVRTRENQQFNHERRFALGYSPFSFLQLDYGSNVQQDLGELGQRESFDILVRDTTADGTFSQAFAVDPFTVRDPDGEVYRALVEAGVIADGDDYPASRLEVLGGSTLDVLPFGDVVSRLFQEGARTERYDQTASARLSVSTGKVKWLKWIRPQEVSYQTSYSWADQPLADFEDLDIAGVGTRAQIQTGLQLQPRELFRLFPFYRKLETREKASTAGRAPADSSGGGFRLNPGAIARKTLLAITGVNDATLTYRGSLTSSSNGVSGDGFSLISGLQGRAPSLGYRLGLDRTVPLGLRLTDADVRLQQEDVLQNQHDIEGRTALQPFSTLRIGLRWSTGWQNNQQIRYDFDDGGTLFAQDAIRNGSGESSVLAIGGSYDALVARQRDRYLDDLASGERDENGFLVSETLTRTGLARDFQNEFGRGIGRYGPGGLFTLPMPSWDVNYSGLSKWPLLQKLTQQVTVTHGYSASSRSAYRSSLLTAEDRLSQARRRTLPTPDGSGAQPIVVPSSALGSDAVDPETLTLNERFQPLVGLNVGWKGGLQTDVNWSKSNLYTLNTQQTQLIQKNISDIRLEVSFQKTGLKLFGLKGLNNNVKLSLSGSVADDQTITRSITSDLEDDLQGEDRNAPTIVSVQRISIWPRLSYAISSQVTADFYVRYEATRPENGTVTGDTSSLDSGVSFRISFSN